MDRHELKHALHDYAREEQFRRDITGINSDLRDGLGGAVKSGIGTAAGVGAAGVVVGVAAARNLRFRYKLQAFLHFPFSYLVAACAFIMIGVMFTGGDVSDEAAMALALVPMALAVPVSIIWSIVYIRLRTLPKLRALEGR